MKVVTSVTTWNDAVGKRISITYSEIDDETGEVVSDNRRVDRVVTDQAARGHIDALMEYAASFIGE